MDLSIPKTSQQWNVIAEGGATSLKFTKQPVPELGDNQVLVKIRGASLNYRDIMIIQGTYPFDLKPEVIPGSDGAGTVLAVGKNVARFRPGDNVVTMLNPQHLEGSITKEMSKHVIGSAVDGTLRSVGAFEEQGLVKMPAGLSFTEAATLTCAGLTAWNALFGLSNKKLLPGQWVLTQGTGGVSIFATQFAKAIGARVIAMSSSEEKAELLKKLGADHIINYRETPNWGPIVRDLTEGVGVDYVVEVVGPTTMRQSVASVKLDGVISVVGSVGGEAAEMPNLLECWTNLFTARGLWVGSRIQMEDMCRTIESNLDVLRPIIDQVFTLEQVEEGLEYLASGKHQGKVCIDIA